MHDSDGVMLWDPDTGGRRAPRIREFADRVKAARGVAVPNYDALWRWSVEDDGPFWEAIRDYSAVGAREEGIHVTGCDNHSSSAPRLHAGKVFRGSLPPVPESGEQPLPGVR